MSEKDSWVTTCNYTQNCEVLKTYQVLRSGSTSNFRDKFLEDEEILKILQVEFGTKVNVKVIVEWKGCSWEGHRT